jgi:hypothetical protein
MANIIIERILKMGGMENMGKTGCGQILFVHSWSISANLVKGGPLLRKPGY